MSYFHKNFGVSLDGYQVKIHRMISNNVYTLYEVKKRETVLVCTLSCCTQHEEMSCSKTCFVMHCGYISPNFR